MDNTNIRGNAASIWANVPMNSDSQSNGTGQRAVSGSRAKVFELRTCIDFSVHRTMKNEPRFQ